jgi:hypothetical protein
LFFIFAFFRMFRESKRVWLFWSFVGILSIIEFAGIVVFVETVIPGKANPPVADAHSSTLLTQIIKSQRRLEKLLDAQLGTSERQSNPVQSGPAAPPAAVPGPATPVPEHASPVPQTPATPMPAPAER